MPFVGPIESALAGFLAGDRGDGAERRAAGRGGEGAQHVGRRGLFLQIGPLARMRAVQQQQLFLGRATLQLIDQPLQRKPGHGHLSQFEILRREIDGLFVIEIRMAEEANDEFRLRRQPGQPLGDRLLEPHQAFVVEDDRLIGGDAITLHEGILRAVWRRPADSRVWRAMASSKF